MSTSYSTNNIYYKKFRSKQFRFVLRTVGGLVPWLRRGKELDGTNSKWTRRTACYRAADILKDSMGMETVGAMDAVMNEENCNDSLTSFRLFLNTLIAFLKNPSRSYSYPIQSCHPFKKTKEQRRKRRSRWNGVVECSRRVGRDKVRWVRIA